MEIVLTQAKEALERLDEIHAEQIESFDRQLLPDLEKQMSSRKKGFDDLKKSMARLADEINTTPDLGRNKELTHIMDHMQRLMSMNRELTSAVQTHKTGLESSMRQVKKGKQAICAYGSPVSFRNRPRVINLKK